jgi:hypothetical protein
MRKQDRIARDQAQDRSKVHDHDADERPDNREQMTGSSAENQPPKTKREPGAKLPIPD